MKAFWSEVSLDPSYDLTSTVTFFAGPPVNWLDVTSHGPNGTSATGPLHTGGHAHSGQFSEDNSLGHNSLGHNSPHDVVS